MKAVIIFYMLSTYIKIWFCNIVNIIVVVNEECLVHIALHRLKNVKPCMEMLGAQCDL